MANFNSKGSAARTGILTTPGTSRHGLYARKHKRHRQRCQTRGACRNGCRDYSRKHVSLTSDLAKNLSKKKAAFRSDQLAKMLWTLAIPGILLGAGKDHNH